MIKMGENFIMITKSKESINKTKKKRKPKKKIFCKRCGGPNKSHFQIQLTPSRLIKVCTSCFNWGLNKSMKEIREDYAKRSQRKRNE